MIDFILVCGLIMLAIAIFKFLSVFYKCCFWAGHDTMAVYMNLKPNLSIWQIVRGLSVLYVKVFTGAMVDILSGTERIT